MPVAAGDVLLRAVLDGPEVRFAVGDTAGAWQALPDPAPAWTFSDDHGQRLRFTGMFVGVRVDDLDRRGWSAGVDYVDFRFRSA